MGPSGCRCLQCSQTTAGAREGAPPETQSGPGERSTATQEHVSSMNVATRIARGTLRAPVRISVDGKRQVLATPAAARRRTRGDPSTIIGVEIVVVAAVGTSAAKVAAYVSRRRRSRSGHCRDQIDVDWHCQHARLCSTRSARRKMCWLTGCAQSSNQLRCITRKQQETHQHVEQRAECGYPLLH